MARRASSSAPAPPSYPHADPGLIIVDEAHDASLKQQDGFRFHARDLATWRAQQLDIPVVLGSATPALETLQLARQGRFQWLKLSQRATDQGRPPIEILDGRLAAPGKPLLPQSLQAIKHCVEQGNQALVFINRRGYAPMILCQDCGWQAECRRCDSFLTWHRSEGSLRCHHCDYQQRCHRAARTAAPAPSMKPAAAPKNSPNCWNSPYRCR